MRIAIADLGAHTFHLLCARVEPDDTIVPLMTRRHALRLGESLVDGRIPKEMWHRALAALEDIGATAETHGFHLHVVGTSVLRETENGGELADVAAELLGIPVKILSHREEAELVYLGARSTLPSSVGRIAVIDLGGGSLEVALGDAYTIASAWSFPLGTLRLRALSASEIGDRVARGGVEAWAALRAYAPEAVVLTGGSARLIGKLLGKTLVDDAALRSLVRVLASLDDPGKLAFGVSEARLDTIDTACAIFAAIVSEAGRPATICARGLREGFIVRESRR